MSGTGATITFVSGVPGSGKSSFVVQLLEEHAKAGRPIYADGIPELKVTHEPLGDPTTWHEEGRVPNGAVIVIDEAQRVWGTAASGSKITPDVRALETHRHRGIDFIIVSQHPSLVHQNVRRLVGRYVLIRNVGLYGRWRYEWSEMANPETFRSAPIKVKHTLQKRTFALYKSSSMHVKRSRQVPPSLIIFGLAAVAAVLLIWRGYSSVSGKMAGTPSGQAAGAATGPDTARRVSNGAGGPVLAVTAPVKEREPYAGLGLHMAGYFTDGKVSRSWFYASVGGKVVATLADKELLAAGYGWRRLGACSGVLIFGEKERFVTCDVPTVAAAPVPMRSASAPDHSQS